MTVMVDFLEIHPNAWGPFLRGSCHLTATTLEELHEFAAKLGLKREWFQEHRLISHYDLTPSKRALALRLGAEVVPMRIQLGILRRAKESGPDERT
jgi:hypothetical protein